MEDLLNQLKSLRAVDWLIICTVTIAYLPLLWAIYTDKKNGAGQNFYTYILWLILDIAQLISIKIAGGVYIMFFAFIPCCLFATILVRNHKKPINDFEKVAVVLVIVCIPVWTFFGELWAIVIQTTAQVVAGLPQMKDTWQRPKEFKNTLFPLSLFAIAHLISFYRKSGWSIENTLFPTAMLTYTVTSMIPIIVLMVKEKKLHP